MLVSEYDIGEVRRCLGGAVLLLGENEWYVTIYNEPVPLSSQPFAVTVCVRTHDKGHGGQMNRRVEIRSGCMDKHAFSIERQ